MKHSQCCFGAHTLFIRVKHFQNGKIAPRAMKGAHMKQTFEIIIPYHTLFLISSI